jgi:hypothetical protein
MRLLPVRSVLARCAALGALGTLLTAVVPTAAVAQAQWSPWQAISYGALCPEHWTRATGGKAAELV